MHLTGLLTAPPCLDQLMVADNFCHAVIERVVGVKKFAGCGVGKLHLPESVCDQHAIGELFKDCGEAVIFKI